MLTQLPGSPFGVGIVTPFCTPDPLAFQCVFPVQVDFLAVHPDGRHAYVYDEGNVHTGAPAGTRRFAIDATSGGLRLAGYDPPAEPVTFGPSGHFAYSLEPNAGTNIDLRTYSVDGTSGALTATGTPLPVTGVYTYSVLVDAAGAFRVCRLHGRCVRIAICGFAICVYRADPASGALTQVSGSPFMVAGLDSPSTIVATN